MQARLGTPSTIQGFFAGTLQAYQQSLSTEPLLVVTALLSVYIVLGMLYESLVHPLTIISSLPPASVGALLALLLFGQDLNVISIIGIVLLIGLVKKNAIMMIDFALQAERDGGKNTEEAIFEACMLRFRPILMTTMAALFGAIPLAFGTGTGSELRRPLGNCHHRWPDRQPDADAVHHAGRLSVHGPVQCLVGIPTSCAHNRGTIHMNKLRTRVVYTAVLALLCSCAAGPEYRGPATDAPQAYRELTAAQFKDTDGWKVAAPQDAILRDNWWELFADPQLNALEARVKVSNQNVAAAYAAFMQARALVRQAQAAYWPTLSVGVSATRSRQPVTLGSGAGAATTGNDFSLPFDASWTPDLWGGYAIP